MTTFSCPKCGKDSGYYTSSRATIKTYYDGDGVAFDSEVVRYAVGSGQRYRCWDCDDTITAYVKKLQSVEN